MEKEYLFDTFMQAIEFVNQVAKISEEVNHHPSITIDYDKVKIFTITHDAGDTVTEKDTWLLENITDYYVKNYENAQ